MRTRESGPSESPGRLKSAADQSNYLAADGNRPASGGTAGTPDHAAVPNGELVGTALRPCRECGTEGMRPSVMFSILIDEATRARGWSNAELAAAAGISASYAWRLRRPHKTTCRPSFTVARQLADALELTGDDRRLLLQTARAGVGYDLVEVR